MSSYSFRQLLAGLYLLADELSSHVWLFPLVTLLKFIMRRLFYVVFTFEFVYFVQYLALFKDAVISNSLFLAHNSFQVYNFETKNLLSEMDMLLDVCFWKWANEDTIILITETSVFQWQVFTGESVNLKYLQVCLTCLRRFLLCSRDQWQGLARAKEINE